MTRVVRSEARTTSMVALGGEVEVGDELVAPAPRDGRPGPGQRPRAPLAQAQVLGRPLGLIGQAHHVEGAAVTRASTSARRALVRGARATSAATVERIWSSGCEHQPHPPPPRAGVRSTGRPATRTCRARGRGRPPVQRQRGLPTRWRPARPPARSGRRSGRRRSGRRCRPASGTPGPAPPPPGRPGPAGWRCRCAGPGRGVGAHGARRPRCGLVGRPAPPPAPGPAAELGRGERQGRARAPRTRAAAPGSCTCRRSCARRRSAARRTARPPGRPGGDGGEQLAHRRLDRPLAGARSAPAPRRWLRGPGRGQPACGRPARRGTGTAERRPAGGHRAAAAVGPRGRSRARTWPRKRGLDQAQPAAVARQAANRTTSARASGSVDPRPTSTTACSPSGARRDRARGPAPRPRRARRDGSKCGPGRKRTPGCRRRARPSTAGPSSLRWPAPKST